MADIARIEFEGIMNRTGELKKNISHESDWERYRLVIHPQLLKAIGDLFNQYMIVDTASAHDSLLIPVVQDPNVEGWLLRALCDEIASRQGN